MFGNPLELGHGCHKRKVYTFACGAFSGREADFVFHQDFFFFFESEIPSSCAKLETRSLSVLLPDLHEAHAGAAVTPTGRVMSQLVHSQQEESLE